VSNAYIVSAARTPIGRFGGGLSQLSPVELGAHAMKAALKRAGVPADQIDFYIYGNVLSGGQGQLIPRQAALKAGVPAEIDGYHVNMVCSSGMLAAMNADTHIRAGDGDLILVGGTESMSTAGFYLTSRARWGYKYLGGQNEPLIDLLAYDGLTDPTTGEMMGTQTDRLAAEYGVTREEVDEVSVASHLRAAAATENGALTAEIEPIEVRARKGSQTIAADEGIRPDSSMESLARLRPAFTDDGIITAGNASQISDGSAAMLIASEAAVKAHGLKPIAKILGSAWSAGESWRFAEAPAPAVEKVLAKTGLAKDDVALWENNEAFAVSTVLFERQLGIDRAKINVHGGAVALGHPIGATGARIMVTLLGALAARNETIGVAALCHGTGGSTAIALERLG
jgi:acetyl-CoA C-acetyltransferase